MILVKSQKLSFVVPIKNNVNQVMSAYRLPIMLSVSCVVSRTYGGFWLSLKCFCLIIVVPVVNVSLFQRPRVLEPAKNKLFLKVLRH